jgi:hypothetical protein
VIRAVGWSTFILGLTVAAFTGVVVLRSSGGTPPFDAGTASAQECVSEALPVQAPAPPQTVADEPARLPATGNAGLLSAQRARLRLQECPTPVAPPTSAPAEPTVATPAPVASATPAPAPTATVTGPGVELPGGGGAGGGLDFPPGTVSY